MVCKILSLFSRRDVKIDYFITTFAQCGSRYIFTSLKFRRLQHNFGIFMYDFHHISILTYLFSPNFSLDIAQLTSIDWYPAVKLRTYLSTLWAILKNNGVKETEESRNHLFIHCYYLETGLSLKKRPIRAYTNHMANNMFTSYDKNIFFIIFPLLTFDIHL